MNLLNRIKQFFGAETPRALQNKVGGMAYVKYFGDGDLCDEIAGSIVTTVSFDGGTWDIQPHLSVKTKDRWRDVRGLAVGPGWLGVTGIEDARLVPIRDIGDDEQDESASYLPPVPAAKPEILALQVREMRSRT